MITIIVGTNRANSASKQVALYYQKEIMARALACEIIDLVDLPADFTFSALYHNAGKNEAFNEFQTKIDSCRKFIFIAPEYNGSFPGVLKTFLDGLRYPDTFHLKEVALVGVSAGVLGNAVGLGHLSDVLSYMGANVLGLRVKLGILKQHFNGDDFTLPLYKDFITKQINQLLER